MKYAHFDARVIDFLQSFPHRIIVDDKVDDIDMPSHPKTPFDNRYLKRWNDVYVGSGPVLIAHSYDEMDKCVYLDESLYSGLSVQTELRSKNEYTWMAISAYLVMPYPYNCIVYTSNPNLIHNGRCTVVADFIGSSARMFKSKKGKPLMDYVEMTWYPSDPEALAFNKLKYKDWTFLDEPFTNNWKDPNGRKCVSQVIQALHTAAVNIAENIDVFRAYMLFGAGPKDPVYWDMGPRKLPSKTWHYKMKRIDDVLPTFDASTPKPDPITKSVWVRYNLGSGLPPRFVLGFETAYRRALTKIDLGHVPMFSYVWDFAMMCKDAARGNAPSAVKRAKTLWSTMKDTWMKYRYVYSTTKSDVYEMYDLATALAPIAELQDSTLSATGEYYNEFGDRYRVTFEFNPVGFLQGSTAKTLLDRINDLGPYEIWDVIPYSFIVDWFIDVGGVLEELERWNEVCQLKPTNIWFSYDHADEHTDTFFRIRGYQMSGFGYLSEPQSVGHDTLVKRMIDGVCLISR